MLTEQEKKRIICEMRVIGSEMPILNSLSNFMLDPDFVKDSILIHRCFLRWAAKNPKAYSMLDQFLKDGSGSDTAVVCESAWWSGYVDARKYSANPKPSDIFKDRSVSDEDGKSEDC